MNKEKLKEQIINILDNYPRQKQIEYLLLMIENAELRGEVKALRREVKEFQTND